MAGKAGAIRAGRAYVELFGDDSKLVRALKRAASRVKAFGRKVLGIGSIVAKVGQQIAKFGAILGAVGIAAIVYFTKAASDAEEKLAKFKTVFRGVETAAKKWADNFATQMGRAKSAVYGWMAGLQDTFVPLGYSRKQAMKMSTSITQLAADLASFNNIPTEDVIRDLTSAIVGNHETVRKYGVIITEATLKEYAYSKGIATVGKELTNQEKVQARVGIIMEQTKDAQGDLLRTSDSFANTLKRLGGRWQNLRERIGEVMKEDVKGWISGVSDFIEENQDKIVGMAQAVWNFFDSVSRSIWNMLKSLWTGEGKAASGFQNAAESMIKSLTTVEFSIKNLGKTWEHVLDKMALAYLKWVQKYTTLALWAAGVEPTSALKKRVRESTTPEIKALTGAVAAHKEEQRLPLLMMILKRMVEFRKTVAGVREDLGEYVAPEKPAAPGGEARGAPGGETRVGREARARQWVQMKEWEELRKKLPAPQKTLEDVKARVIGTFLHAKLLGRMGEAADDRTADATEETAKSTKEILAELRDMQGFIFAGEG